MALDRLYLWHAHRRRAAAGSVRCWCDCSRQPNAAVSSGDRRSRDNSHSAASTGSADVPRHRIGPPPAIHPFDIHPSAPHACYRRPNLMESFVRNFVYSGWHRVARALQIISRSRQVEFKNKSISIDDPFPRGRRRNTSIITYQCTHQFSPCSPPHAAACNSNCRLCSDWHRPRATIALHQHGRMSKHCAMDAIHLRRMPVSMHRSPARIRRLRGVHNLSKCKNRIFITNHCSLAATAVGPQSQNSDCISHLRNKNHANCVRAVWNSLSVAQPMCVRKCVPWRRLRSILISGQFELRSSRSIGTR